LRGRLSTVLNDPRFHVVEEPAAPGDPSDDEVKSIFDEYSKATDDAAAFKLLFTKATDFAHRRMTGSQQHEAARESNRQRLNGLLAAVKQQMTEVLQTQAPDIQHHDIFWSWAAERAAQETPATLRHPIERWEWQLQRGVELYRERFGTSAPAPGPSPTANQRPATAVIPGGSLRPQGGAPARPKSFSEQLDAKRERILPGASRQ
jgi:hypothetical protein